MNSLIPLKSNCITALEQCIKDCHSLIRFHKHSAGLERCVELSQLCLDACAECLDACESARLDRGKMMHICVKACKRLSAECKKHTSEACQRCAASCDSCVEEFSHLIAWHFLQVSNLPRIGELQCSLNVFTKPHKLIRLVMNDVAPRSLMSSLTFGQRMWRKK